MRISDWSSVVCSSDLVSRPSGGRASCNPFEKQGPIPDLRPGRTRGSDRYSLRWRPIPPLRPDLWCNWQTGSLYAWAPAQRHCPWENLGSLHHIRSEEHTSDLQSLMRISYAVFCLKHKKKPTTK